MLRFDGRVALITGAGGGLGRGYACELASRGARVLVNDIRGADETVSAIHASGGEAVANADSVETHGGALAIVDAALEAYGRLDVVVNNAGFLRDRTFEKMSFDELDAVIGVHLLGPMYVTKAAWPAMKRNGYGRVVLVSSTTGLYGNFGQTNYAAAKLGIVGFMNALKEEGRKSGILVNAIAPLARTRASEDVFDASLAQAMRIDWIVALVTYLVSEACTANGHLIHTGAGRYARARIAENAGITFPLDAPITAEEVEVAYPAIVEEPPTRTFENAVEAVRAKGIESTSR